jgi:hypothetical protein
MSGFWPTGLDISDTAPPTAILKTAQGEWETKSGGVLTLVLQEAESESGNTMIIVHAKYIPGNRTATLFSVVHRPNAPYPVTIQAEKEDLPEFLKKSYRKPDLGDIASIGMYGQEIQNKWVSDTPSEFRSKLEEAFNLGSVKRVVLSLISHTPPAEGETVVGEGGGPPSEQE